MCITSFISQPHSSSSNVTKISLRREGGTLRGNAHWLQRYTIIRTCREYSGRVYIKQTSE